MFRKNDYTLLEVFMSSKAVMITLMPSNIIHKFLLKNDMKINQVSINWIEPYFFQRSISESYIYSPVILAHILVQPQTNCNIFGFLDRAFL